MENNDSEGFRLKEIISYLDISNIKFAKMIGKSPNYISMLITGKKKINDKLLFSITKAVPNLNKDWLLTGKGEMFNTNNSFSAIEAKQVRYIEDKFKEITEDELALYFSIHIERLKNHKLINSILNKEAWKIAVKILSERVNEEV